MEKNMSMLDINIPGCRITNQEIIDFKKDSNIDHIPTADLKYIEKALPYIEYHANQLHQAKQTIEDNNISFMLLVKDRVCSKSHIYHNTNTIFKEFVLYEASKHNLLVNSSNITNKSIKDELSEALKKLESKVDKDLEILRLKQENKMLLQELSKLSKNRNIVTITSND